MSGFWAVLLLENLFVFCFFGLFAWVSRFEEEREMLGVIFEGTRIGLLIFDGIALIQSVCFGVVSEWIILLAVGVLLLGFMAFAYKAVYRSVWIKSDEG